MPHIPYSRQTIEDDDIKAVCEVLRSDMLTTGPLVEKFEQAVANFVGADFGVALCNGTAALHATMATIGIKPGDEVIVPAMTFAATANCVVFMGGKPVITDVTPGALLLDPEQVEAKITPQTKAIIAVDYAGQPCDYDALKNIAKRHGLFLIDDACHALGAEYKKKRIGALVDLSVFSFHPVKQITTGEGGMVTTNNPEFAEKIRRFRNHGITTDHHQRTEGGTWYYEMTDLGYNYRITDFQCALGISQLKKLPAWHARRLEIAAQYDKAFADLAGITPLSVSPDITHAYHLYVVRIDLERTGVSRRAAFQAFRNAGIGVNVHYLPVHLHPFYRNNFGYNKGDCPVAEQAYEQIISLPIYPTMTDENTEKVIKTVLKIFKKN